MIYVTGGDGQLGSELKKMLPGATFLNRAVLDLSNLTQVAEFLKTSKASLLINCAAYNQVDLAEKEQALALRINAEIPELLAQSSRTHRFKLIHFSTDYVFDGAQGTPYGEADKTAPLNFYGRTKRDGELRVLAANPESLVIRTSWVHSAFGSNFVKTLLKAGRERDELKVVDDQVGTLTWARDLAAATLLGRELSGLFHYSNEGVSSRYDIVCAMKKLTNFKARVVPVRSSAFPSPAARPHYSVLDKSKIKQALHITIPHWTESLELCLKEQSS